MYNITPSGLLNILLFSVSCAIACLRLLKCRPFRTSLTTYYFILGKKVNKYTQIFAYRPFISTFWFYRKFYDRVCWCNLYKFFLMYNITLSGLLNILLFSVSCTIACLRLLKCRPFRTFLHSGLNHSSFWPSVHQTIQKSRRDDRCITVCKHSAAYGIPGSISRAPKGWHDLKVKYLPHFSQSRESILSPIAWIKNR